MKQYDFINDPESSDENQIVVADAPKRKLDILPRLICLLIAAVVWLYMVNLNDTGVPSTLTLEVVIEGAEELKDSNNMLIYGVDKTEITITVKGSNRDLNKYTEEDYTAYVDVRGISEVGKHSLPIQIRTPEGSTISVDSPDQLKVTLYSDYSLTKSVPFDCVSNDIYIVSGYNYSIEKSDDYIEISGPKSVIDTIETAKYIIEDKEFRMSKTYTGFALSFCDRNGDFVSFEKGMVTYSTTNVRVTVAVTTKKTVPINVIVISGEDKGAKAIPETVTLIGDPTVLAAIDEYIIYLSSAYDGRDIMVTLTGDQFPKGVVIEEEGANALITFEKASN